MSDREVRISLDGDSVAVRSDNAPDAWNAWAVMNAINGGYWAKTDQVADWDIVTEVESAPPPEVPDIPQMPMAPPPTEPENPPTEPE